MRTWNGPNGLLPGKSWFRNLLDEMSITLILETLKPMLCYNAMLQCLYVIMLQRNSAMSGKVSKTPVTFCKGGTPTPHPHAHTHTNLQCQNIAML